MPLQRDNGAEAAAAALESSPSPEHLYAAARYLARITQPDHSLSDRPPPARHGRTKCRHPLISPPIAVAGPRSRRGRPAPAPSSDGVTMNVVTGLVTDAKGIAGYFALLPINVARDFVWHANEMVSDLLVHLGKPPTNYTARLQVRGGPCRASRPREEVERV